MSSSVMPHTYTATSGFAKQLHAAHYHSSTADPARQLLFQKIISLKQNQTPSSNFVISHHQKKFEANKS
jgi:hypothetical protein